MSLENISFNEWFQPNLDFNDNTSKSPLLSSYTGSSNSLKFTLEQFTDAINALKTTWDKNTGFSNSMSSWTSSFFISEFGEPACEKIIELLEFIFNDKDNWISYWVYDLDYGSSTTLSATREDGSKIPLSTIEDLYNLLVENYNDNG